MCTWGLANHKDVQTDCSVNATIKGKTYCFSSTDAKSQFMKNPSSNLTKAESFFKRAQGLVRRPGFPGDLPVSALGMPCCSRGSRLSWRVRQSV